MMDGVSVEVAVIPVAGLGTRWLPVTRSVPKELLPVWRACAISYAIDEALAAGITEVVFVTAPGKDEVAEHFRRDEALEAMLESRGRLSMIEPLRERWAALDVRVAVQEAPLGLGHAVLCARDAVGDRPFALLLPDEVLLSTPGATAQLVEQYTRRAGPCLSVIAVPPEETSRYGIVALDEVNPDQITAMVEKPAPGAAPSNLAIIGRYLLTPDLFALLETQTAGHGGEIQLTDGLARLAKARPLYATRFEGTRHDVGQPRGLLLASVDLALREDPSLSAALAALLEARRV